MFYFLPVDFRAYYRILRRRFFPAPISEIVYRPLAEPMEAPPDQTVSFVDLPKIYEVHETFTGGKRVRFSQKLTERLNQAEEKTQEAIARADDALRSPPRPLAIQKFADEIEAWARRAEAGETWDSMEPGIGADWRARWAVQQQWAVPTEAAAIAADYLKLIEAMRAQNTALETQWELCLLAYSLSPPALRGFKRAAALADQLNQHTPEAELVRYMARN